MFYKSCKVASKKSIIFLSFLFIIGNYTTKAQNTKLPSFNFSNGLGITAPDSLFSVNFRFRTQLRTGYTTVSNDDFSASEIEARVRRMRLRFEGFVLDPKLNYYIQLSFSRGDMDWEDNQNSVINSSPNVLRDLVVMYYPNPHLSFIFGQTKLPGNRQRVVSSGSLQFVDRSIVNSNFTIDRDFGLQVEYQNSISSIGYALKGAISSGEGRNSVVSDAGLAYTGRLEVLPFGSFTNGGDYFEGDIEREQTPKLSLAAGYHYNENALRTAGTIGADLYEARNLSSFIADALLKYKGFSLTAEYANRNTDNPITTNSNNLKRTVFVGYGTMFQMSYLFKSNFEIAGRYAIVSPKALIAQEILQREETGLVVTKYLRKHKVKLQSQLFYNQTADLFLNTKKMGQWNGILQIEIGI